MKKEAWRLVSQNKNRKRMRTCWLRRAFCPHFSHLFIDLLFAYKMMHSFDPHSPIEGVSRLLRGTCCIFFFPGLPEGSSAARVEMASFLVLITDQEYPFVLPPSFSHSQLYVCFYGKLCPSSIQDGEFTNFPSLFPSLW